MIKVYFTIICFSLSFANLYSQNKSDSLLNILSNTEESKFKVDLLNDIAKTYIYSIPDSAIVYAEKAVQTADKLGYSSGKSQAFDIIGIYYQNIGETKKAENYYNQSLILRQQLNDPVLISTSLNNFGVLYRRNGDFEKAKEYFFKSLVISKKLNDTVSLSRIYNNLGLVFENLGVYEESLRYHMLSLKEREKLGVKRDVSSSLNNIGKVFISIKEYDKALEYLNKSLEIKKNLNDKHLIASTLINIGIVKYYQNKFNEAIAYNEQSLAIYESLGEKRNIGAVLSNMAFISNKTENYNKALEYNLRSISILEEIQSTGQLCNAYNSIATTYHKIGNLSQALNYALKAKEIASNSKNLGELRFSLEILYKIYYQKKDFKNACIFQEQLSEIKDSLINEVNSEKILELEAKYNNEKKEKEIAQLQTIKTSQELSIEKRDKTIYILLSIFLILSLSTFFISRQNSIKQKHKSLELEQRLFRLQMNPHFIFNALSGIQDYISSKKPLEASSYLSDFAKLMRSVLVNSSTEFISLEDEITTIEHYLKLQQMRFPDKLDYNIDVDPLLNADELVIPPMLTQPFIENAIIHGILKKKSGAGKVNIEFKKNNNYLILSIQNNGIGLSTKDQSQKKHRSMATEITLNRISNFQKSYKQKVKFEIKNIFKGNKQIEGTIVIFHLPIKYVS